MRWAEGFVEEREEQELERLQRKWSVAEAFWERTRAESKSSLRQIMDLQTKIKTSKPSREEVGDDAQLKKLPLQKDKEMEQHLARQELLSQELERAHAEMESFREQIKKLQEQARELDTERERERLTVKENEKEVECQRQREREAHLRVEAHLKTITEEKNNLTYTGLPD